MEDVTEMSTKTITQTVLPAILKSPYAFLAYIGLGFYLVSQISPEQRDNISHFLNILNNLPGYLVLSMMFVVLIYGLFLYPLCKFFGTSLMSLYVEIQRHYHDADKHHDETRQLVVHIGDVAENIAKVVERMYTVEETMQDVVQKLS